MSLVLLLNLINISISIGCCSAVNLCQTFFVQSMPWMRLQGNWLYELWQPAPGYRLCEKMVQLSATVALPHLWVSQLLKNVWKVCEKFCCEMWTHPRLDVHKFGSSRVECTYMLCHLFTHVRTYYAHGCHGTIYTIYTFTYTIYIYTSTEYSDGGESVQMIDKMWLNDAWHICFCIVTSSTNTTIQIHN